MEAKSSENFYNYTVKPGDTLSRIVFKMYGHAPADTRFRKSLEFLISINPQIKNPNRIYPGDLIHLGVLSKHQPRKPQLASLSIKDLHTFSKPEKLKVPRLLTQDEDYFWALSWLEYNAISLVIPGVIATGAAGNLLSPGNTSLINKIGDLYADYKNGAITKGQYDYQPKVTLDQLKKNVGPLEKILFGNKTTHETIRIARGGGIPATAHIDKNFQRLSRVASLGKYGGIVLTGVGVTASCMQIADTEDRQEKNEIFVETISSTVVGTGAGVLVGVFLVSNPVGWGAALLLAVGSTALSYSAGKIARNIYDRNGNKIDIVNGVGVDKICR